MILNALRNLADLSLLALICWTQWRIGAWVWTSTRSQPDRARTLLRTLAAAVAAWLVVGFALAFYTVARFAMLDGWIRGVITGGAYLWMFASTGAYLAHFVWRLLIRPEQVARFDPSRRALVNAAGNMVVAAPFAMTAFGALVQRTDFRIKEVDIPIPNLPRDLQGLRVLQLTDIHMGPFLTEKDFARVIDESLNLRPHLALITGDLITLHGDPLDACLQQIARLRPDAGILGCMGNHESYTGVEDYTERAAASLGIGFLRDRARPLRFGAATLNVAGVDYQSVWNRPNYLHGVERLVAPGAVNLLLSHNPDVFPVAARKGFDVTVAGHTHGGQVTVEILSQTLNAARFITPYVSGYYGKDGKSVYVSRGIGTIGLPVRLGAPPEITLLRLVAA